MMFRTLWIAAAFVMCLATSRLAADEATQPSAVPPGEPRGYFGATLDYEEMDGQGRFHVASLKPGGPAEHGGLEVGDLVTAVNGMTFRFGTELERHEAFLWLRPGDEVTFDVLRGGQAKQVEVTAGTMDPKMQHQWAEFLRVERQALAIKNLRMFGSGQGTPIRVQRNEDGTLAFSAEGFPASTFHHMESYLRTMWIPGQAFDLLQPGDHFMLKIVTRGPRIDVHFEDAPDYIEALSEAMARAGGRQIGG